MIFDKIAGKLGLGKKKEGPEEMELEPRSEPGHHISVRVETLNGINDVERIARLVKDGSILFLRLKDLQRRDVGEFQNTLQKMKRVCIQFNWDMTVVEDGYLVVTPQFAQVEKESANGYYPGKSFFDGIEYES